MGRSKGKRSNTRDLFSKPFRKHGAPLAATYLTNYRLGDYVDVKVDSAIQKEIRRFTFVASMSLKVDVKKNSKKEFVESLKQRWKPKQEEKNLVVL
ncbi:60S ribosomal protein L21-2 [Galdieria sulphuraria]|nr:60S ribosomal protein L21-2 [Galdieria sulphuraria]